MRALAPARQGWKQADIAAALDASETAVSRWLAAARRGGPETLRSHPAPGPVAKLTPEQLGLIPTSSARTGVLTAFGETSEPASVSPGPFTRSSASRTARAKYCACSSTWDGLRRSRSPGRSSGTKKPSNGGGSNRGQFGRRRPAANTGPSFSWTNRASTSCRGGQDLRPAGRDASRGRVADARPSVGYGRRDARRKGVLAGAATFPQWVA